MGDFAGMFLARKHSVDTDSSQMPLSADKRARQSLTEGEPDGGFPVMISNHDGNCADRPKNTIEPCAQQAGVLLHWSSRAHKISRDG